MEGELGILTVFKEHKISPIGEISLYMKQMVNNTEPHETKWLTVNMYLVFKRRKM